MMSQSDKSKSDYGHNERLTVWFMQILCTIADTYNDNKSAYGMHLNGDFILIAYV